MPVVLCLVRHAFGLFGAEHPRDHPERHVHSGRDPRGGEYVRVLDPPRLGYPLNPWSLLGDPPKGELVRRCPLTIEQTRGRQQRSPGAYRGEEAGAASGGLQPGQEGPVGDLPAGAAPPGTRSTSIRGQSSKQWSTAQRGPWALAITPWRSATVMMRRCSGHRPKSSSGPNASSSSKSSNRSAPSVCRESQLMRGPCSWRQKGFSLPLGNAARISSRSPNVSRPMSR